MAQKQNETAAETRARQRQNSLNEQLQKFYKTGRVTKGMAAAGYANVAPQTFVAAAGDSPFSVARKLLGANASEQAVAAFVERQGWDFGFRQGNTYRVQGAFVTPKASASAAFFQNNLGIDQSGVFTGTNTSNQSAPTPGSGVPSLGGGKNTFVAPQNVGAVPETHSVGASGITAGVGASGITASTFNRPTGTYTPSTGATFNQKNASGMTPRYAAAISGWKSPVDSVLSEIGRFVSGMFTGSFPNGFTYQTDPNNPNRVVRVANPSPPTAADQQRITQNQQYIAQNRTVSGNQTGSEDHRFATGALGNQYGIDTAISTLTALRTDPSAEQNLPITINPVVLSRLDKTFANELVASGLYIQQPNGELVIDMQRYQQAVYMTGGGWLPDLPSGGGTFTPGPGGTRGVYDFVRPRGRSRGGVNQSGTDALARDATTSSFSASTGGLPTNWRVRF